MKPHRSLLALLICTALPLAAQGATKQAQIPKHVRDELWPTRPLTAVEQSFRDRIVAMRDTVITLRSTIDQVDRARRNRDTPAVLASMSRALQRDCARVEANGSELGKWAATLSTDNSRFGDPAVKSFRASIAELQQSMVRCGTGVTAATDSQTGRVDPDKLYAILVATRPVLDRYDRAAMSLANTLTITIDADEKS